MTKGGAKARSGCRLRLFFKKKHLIVSIVNMGCIFYWTPFGFLEFSFAHEK